MKDCCGCCGVQLVAAKSRTLLWGWEAPSWKCVKLYEHEREHGAEFPLLVRLQGQEEAIL